MQTDKPALYGLVLEGGLSSRMGKNKAYLTYHKRPQREHAFGLLEKFCHRVYYSAGKQAPPDVHTIVDAFPFQGPLNGILSAFKRYPGVAWLTLPVDMPLVDEGVIRFLVAHRDAAKAATCFYDTEGKLPEPLVTIWEPHAPLPTFYAKGKTSPREFLMGTNANLLHIPSKMALKNINTPEDFKGFFEH